MQRVETHRPQLKVCLSASLRLRVFTKNKASERARREPTAGPAHLEPFPISESVSLSLQFVCLLFVSSLPTLSSRGAFLLSRRLWLFGVSDVKRAFAERVRRHIGDGLGVSAESALREEVFSDTQRLQAQTGAAAASG